MFFKNDKHTKKYMYICIWVKCKINTNSCCYVTVYQCYICKCIMKNTMVKKSATEMNEMGTSK